MKKQSGFTLIELMIAMAILAILATAGLSAYTGYLKRGRDTSRAALAIQVNTEVMNYAGGNGGKPPADQTAFDSFLQSAAESFGKSPEEADSGIIIQDPVGGKNVCLDANGVAGQPCVFHYTSYTDGTYAISYGVEDPASKKTNFYKTSTSVAHPADSNDPPTLSVIKYGVYIGTAPYLGGPSTASNGEAAVDSGMTRTFMSHKLNAGPSTIFKANGVLCASNAECSSGWCKRVLYQLYDACTALRGTPCVNTTDCSDDDICIFNGSGAPVTTCTDPNTVYGV